MCFQGRPGPAAGAVRPGTCPALRRWPICALVHSTTSSARARVAFAHTHIVVFFSLLLTLALFVQKLAGFKQQMDAGFTSIGESVSAIGYGDNAACDDTCSALQASGASSSTTAAVC